MNKKQLNIKEFDANFSKWQLFQQEEQLSEKQLQQFQQYANLLVEWNEKINLTRIVSLSDIIQHHFQDSLRIGSYIDLKQKKTIADIGSGAGFPGIPLKIVYPALTLILIEVNGKKVRFLEEVIKKLALLDVVIVTLDWRTFLRRTDYAIDYFLARASVSPQELVRAFSPICRHRLSTVVYWASSGWVMNPKLEQFFKREEMYHIGKIKRRFIFFGYNAYMGPHRVE